MKPQFPLFVVGRFPPPMDGQSLATARLASLLEPIHRVHRFNTEPNDGVEASDTKFRPARIGFFLKQRQRLKQQLRSLPGAPVLWTSISSTFLGHWRDILITLPALGMKRPVVAMIHRSTFHSLFESIRTRRSALNLVEKVDQFVFLTEELSERCHPWIPTSKRVVIHNTIDDDIICSSVELDQKRHGFSGTPFKLVFVSNMMPEKGYDDVVEAHRILEARGIPVQTHFYGAWPNARDEQAFLSRTEGMNALHKGSVTSRPEVKKILLNADAFVLPTYHPTEGMPLSIIEALNAGVPVITTRRGGIPEMIEEGVSGLFVPAQDPEAIAAAVQTLRDTDTWMRISRGARSRFLDLYQPDAARKKWEALLKALGKGLT